MVTKPKERIEELSFFLGTKVERVCAQRVGGRISEKLELTSLPTQYADPFQESTTAADT